MDEMAKRKRKREACVKAEITLAYLRSDSFANCRVMTGDRAIFPGRADQLRGKHRRGKHRTMTICLVRPRLHAAFPLG
jgi:hypothetical protein